MPNSLQKLQPIFIAMTMFLVIAPWFAPTSEHIAQIDFWAVWFVTVCVLTLPMLFLEVALAKRSNNLPLLGMEELTRQADAPTFWRSTTWSAVVVLAFLSGGLIASAGLQLSSLAAISSLGVTPLTLVVGLIFAVLALSFVAHFLVILAFLIALAAVVTSGLNVTGWQLTSFNSTEWQQAVLLALTCTGVGTSIIWQHVGSQGTNKGTSTVFPIWIGIVLAGSIFALFKGINTELSSTLLAVASIGFASMLFATLKQNLHAKTNNIIKATAIPFILTTLFALASFGLLTMKSSLLPTVIGLFSIISALLFAIFVGWKMKISHLRKAIAFNAEAVYNLWRVAVRIVIPLILMSALVVSVKNLFV